MNRRGFIATSAKALLAASAAGVMSPSQARANPYPKDISIFDAHAHPYWIHRLGRQGGPTAPTVQQLVESRVAACPFAAVGDMFIWDSSRFGPKSDTDNQLDVALSIIKYKKMSLLKKAGHLQAIQPGKTSGAILAIEGADCLEGRVDNVDHFYRRGVRIMSLVHYRINELGDIMTEPAQNGGLTKTGARVVERINKLGLVLDLSHADGPTLKKACLVSTKPVIDSHCSPTPENFPYSLRTRLRAWDEMEAIVKTNGVICLWPFGVTADLKAKRIKRTMDLWVAEILAIKKRFGMEHVGLGTDGGGNLRTRVDGWENITSWPLLHSALEKAGLNRTELEAFFQGNMKRVWAASLA